MGWRAGLSLIKCCFVHAQIIVHTVGIQFHWQTWEPCTALECTLLPRMVLGPLGYKWKGVLQAICTSKEHPTIDVPSPVLELGMKCIFRGKGCLLGEKMRQRFWETSVQKGDVPCADRVLLALQEASGLPALDLFSWPTLSSMVSH